MTVVNREQVRNLMRQGAQVLDVLPASAYRKSHLRGAINLPLAEFQEAKLRQLDRERPIVTYCYDRQ